MTRHRRDQQGQRVASIADSSSPPERLVAEPVRLAGAQLAQASTAEPSRIVVPPAGKRILLSCKLRNDPAHIGRRVAGRSVAPRGRGRLRRRGSG